MKNDFVYLGKKFKEYKKEFCILFFIFLVGIYPIIRANYNYLDDISRVAFGYQGWNNFSRYISCFLSNFIHADSYLTDVSPLPQLIAIVFLAIAGIMILCLLSNKKKFSVWEIVAIIPLGLSPYFLECISYKYDAPYMALSVLVAIVPLLFYKYGLVNYLIMSLVCSLVVCTTYQASSGIFPMLVVLFSLKRWNNKESIKEILKFIIVSIVGYCGGLIIFKIFLMAPFDDYVSNSIPAANKIVVETIKHFKIYFNCLFNDFKDEWLLFIGLMCLGYVYVMVRDSKQKKLYSCIMALLSLIFMILLSFGVYPFLAGPLYAARAMYGFGVFIALIGCSIMISKKAYFFKFACIGICWCFFVFSFTYGNALYVQKEYTDFRITSVLNDLKDLPMIMDNQNTRIQIIGTIGYSPILRNMPQDYNMLSRLVPITFSYSSRTWGKAQFADYYNLSNLIWIDSVDLSTYDLPIIVDNMYHTIKGNDKFILIILK